MFDELLLLDRNPVRYLRRASAWLTHVMSVSQRVNWANGASGPNLVGGLMGDCKELPFVGNTLYTGQKFYVSYLQSLLVCLITIGL